MAWWRGGEPIGEDAYGRAHGWRAALRGAAWGDAESRLGTTAPHTPQLGGGQGPRGLGRGAMTPAFRELRGPVLIEVLGVPHLGPRPLALMNGFGWCTANSEFHTFGN